MVPDGIRVRLERQRDAVDMLVALAPAEAFDARPPSGDWSARENLAHLARHAEVFLERLERILREDRPDLGRYSAERDPGWADCGRLSLDQVLDRHRAARARLSDWAGRLGAADVARTGRHPVLGELTVAQWLEFFLLHEAHHLYVATLRLGEARQAVRPRKETP